MVGEGQGQGGHGGGGAGARWEGNATKRYIYKDISFEVKETVMW